VASIYYVYIDGLTNKTILMKRIYFPLFAAALFIGCQPPVDNSADEAFVKNSETVRIEIASWKSESMDYDALYAANAVVLETAFEAGDSLTLSEIKENNARMWEMFDFEMITDPLVLLPGVNTDTKKADGSVRYYGVWKVTLPATDSTEARSGELKFYESYDFNAEGKIIYQQGYGDFGGLFEYLMEDEDEDEDEKTELE